jgi:DNA-directed RNA polymerase alpha subunit
MASQEQKDQAKLEAEWFRIGLSAPARRALVDAKLYKVSDLRKISSAELSALPGMAKSSIARIKVIMAAKKISFKRI